MDKWDSGEDMEDSGASTYSTSVFIVSRLRKFTKYEIVIQAVNQYGEGPLSRPSVGQTQEDGKKIYFVKIFKLRIDIKCNGNDRLSD